MSDRVSAERDAIRERADDPPTRNPYVEALQAQPRSAGDLAKALGRNTDRATVASIRATLERLERQGRVQRAQDKAGGPWIWEAVDRG